MKITCPKCGHVTEITSHDLASVDYRVVCPKCMSSLKVDGDYAYIPTDANSFEPEPEPVEPEPVSSDAPWTAPEGTEDPLLADAIEYVKMCNAISVEMLQRYLDVPYERAADIMDRLEKQGIVGPPTGGPRQILIPHNSSLFGVAPRNREETAMIKDFNERVANGEIKTHTFGCSGCTMVIFGLLLFLLILDLFAK